VEHLQRSLALQPGRFDVHCNLGVAFFRLGRFEEAIACYREALRLQPASASAHNNLGNALRAANRSAEAVEPLREALHLRPDFPEAHCNLGQVLATLGKTDEALEAYQQALRLRPDFATAHRKKGILLAQKDQPADAISCLREATRLEPNSDEAFFHLGNALRETGQLEEAIASYQTALRLRPESIATANNLGVSLVELQRYAEADAVYRSALRHAPDHPTTLNNLGVALKGTHQLDEAQDCFARVLRTDPDHVEAHRNRAMTWLLAGDFARGLPEYEWRLRQPGRDVAPFGKPRWDGSPLAGRTILLHTEQGLGDTLQFVRYGALLREQGTRVLLLAPRVLAPLLRSCPAIDQVVVPGEAVPSCDVQAPLMSLPWLCRTTLDTIPRQIPYLTVDEGRIQRWAGVLRSLQGFRVGIAWQGSPHYVADRGRSIPLCHFRSLAEVEGVRLVGLQKGPGLEQLAGVDFPVISFDRQMDEGGGAFLDTAALMRNLDLVVTSDSAVAHLAGALGVRTWLVLGVTPDWRWLLDREDSPWYPTLRLFRQTAVGEWEPVFTRVAEELTRLGRQSTANPGVPIEVSPGELLDRLSILRIKNRRIADADKRERVRKELHALLQVRARHLPELAELTQLEADLQGVNEAMWEVEDALRLCEREQNFGERFVALSRSVYRHNDRRAALKRRINALLGSTLDEQKAYPDYA
jgi:tetratricopeptide (TPR) repeat protein